MIFSSFRNRSGASMIMVLSLIGMVLVMSFGVSQIIVNSIRTGVKLENADEAYYVSEGGVEKALKEVKSHEAGYSIQNQKTEYKEKNTGQGGSQPAGVSVGNDAYSNFKIEGLIADKPFDKGTYDKKYSVPATGSGEAGGADCRKLGPIVSEADLWKAPGMVVKSQSGQGTLLFTDPADHPCNWGVIRPNETVSVPLFVQESSTKYLNPAMTMDLSGTPTATAGGLGMKNLVMRFRAPCKMQDLKDTAGNPTGKKFRPTVCKTDNGSEGREELEEDATLNPDTVLNWSIDGAKWDNNTGPTGVLLTSSGYHNSFIDFNTNLSSSFINSRLGQLKPFFFDEQSLTALSGDQTNPNFIKSFINIDAGSDVMHKPALKLSLNKPLKNNSTAKDPVPYLEYQIVSDVRLADSSPLIEVEGFQNGVKQTIKIQPNIEKGILDFAVD